MICLIWFSKDRWPNDSRGLSLGGPFLVLIIRIALELNNTQQPSLAVPPV